MQRTYQLSEIAPTRAEGKLGELLLREGTVCHFTAGAIIQQQGDEGDGFWLIRSGTVTLCRFTPDGNVTVFGVLGPNDLFGELAYFAGISRQVDALAEGDATLVRIGAPLIERLLASEPEFAHWLLKSLSNQLRVALDRIEEGRQLSAEQRMVRMLAEMARRDGKTLGVSQQALGELIGVSRVTAGHILRRLEAGGLITLDYRRITVPDPDRLAALL